MPESLFRQQSEAFARRVFEDTLAFSKDPETGVTREGYGPAEERLHDYLKAWGRGLGLEERTDAAGNLFLTLPGNDRALPSFMTGSHSDSVPQGGHFDGLAGIVAAMCAIRWLKEQGIALERDVTLAAFRLEENSFFGRAYVGSSAFAGVLAPEDLALRHRSGARTLADSIREAGFDPEAMTAGRPLADLSRIGAFVELHIEQGPTLDMNPETRVGIVTGIRGSRLHKRARCLGETAHAGAVDRRFRHDAVLAGADLLSRLDRHWDAWLAKGRDLVFTPGIICTAPSAAVSVIAGEVAFSLDMRSLDPAVIDAFHELLLEEARTVEKERGVRFEFDPILRMEPCALDPGLQGAMEAAAAKAGIMVLRMPSGAGHDSAVLSNAGIPTGMIFVANQDGSHNPREKMKIDDFLLGAEVLLGTIESF